MCALINVKLHQTFIKYVSKHYEVSYLFDVALLCTQVNSNNNTTQSNASKELLVVGNRCVTILNSLISKSVFRCAIDSAPGKLFSERSGYLVPSCTSFDM